jgi:hypothetical protein
MPSCHHRIMDITGHQGSSKRHKYIKALKMPDSAHHSHKQHQTHAHQFLYFPTLTNQPVTTAENFPNFNQKRLKWHVINASSDKIKIIPSVL